MPRAAVCYQLLLGVLGAAETDGAGTLVGVVHQEVLVVGVELQSLGEGNGIRDAVLGKVAFGVRFACGKYQLEPVGR